MDIETLRSTQVPERSATGAMHIEVDKSYGTYIASADPTANCVINCLI